MCRPPAGNFFPTIFFSAKRKHLLLKDDNEIVAKITILCEVQSVVTAFAPALFLSFFLSYVCVFYTCVCAHGGPGSGAVPFFGETMLRKEPVQKISLGAHTHDYEISSGHSSSSQLWSKSFFFQFESYHNMVYS